MRFVPTGQISPQVTITFCFTTLQIQSMKVFVLILSQQELVNVEMKTSIAYSTQQAIQMLIYLLLLDLEELILIMAKFTLVIIISMVLIALTGQLMDIVQGSVLMAWLFGVAHQTMPITMTKVVTVCTKWGTRVGL